MPESTIVPIRNVETLSAALHLPFSLRGAAIRREDEDKPRFTLDGGQMWPHQMLDVVVDITKGVIYELLLSEKNVNYIRVSQDHPTDERHCSVLRALLSPQFKVGDIIAGPHGTVRIVSNTALNGNVRLNSPFGDFVTEASWVSLQNWKKIGERT